MSEEDTAGTRRWKPSHNRWAIAVVVTFAAFMEILDTTIVNVALPHIAGGLSTSFDEATWTLTSYLVANGIVLTISGWLSTVFGRKRYFLICLGMFTVFAAPRPACRNSSSSGSCKGFSAAVCSPPNKRSSSIPFRPSNAPRLSASPRSQRLSRRCLGRRWEAI